MASDHESTPLLGDANLRRSLTPKIEKNLQAEKITICEDGLYTYQPPEKNLAGDGHAAKLLKYNNDVGTLKALFYVSGTVICDANLWRTCFAYWLIASLAAVFAFEFQRMNVSRGRMPVTDFADKVEIMANYFTGLIGFMISMFVTTLFGRWWDITSKGIGGLWGVINNLTMVLSIHMPNAADRPFKIRVLRLGLLSHRLIYAQAQECESREDLQQLVDVGLMTAEELDLLDGQASKSQVIWVWIGQLLHKFAEKGKLQCVDVTLPRLDQLCEQARGAIGLIFCYTGTQVPFAYVHLLVLSILISNFLIALKCGIHVGFIIGQNDKSDAFAVVVQVFHITIIPFFYHAFIRIGLELANPLSADYMSLPGYSYHVWMRDENLAFLKAGETPPKSLLQDV